MRVIAADKILADFGLRLFQNLGLDFIAAEGGHIVIPKHFSHQPNTTGVQILTKMEGGTPLLPPGVKKKHFPNFLKHSFLCPIIARLPLGSTRGPPGTTQ